MTALDPRPEPLAAPGEDAVTASGPAAASATMPASAPAPSSPGAQRSSRSALLLVVLATALAPVAWGTTYLVTTQLLPEGPLFASAMRALPAGIIAIAFARTLPKGVWWFRAAVLGILNIGAFFPLLFVSATRLPGGVAATLGAAQPVVVAILAVLVLRERLDVGRLVAGLVGVVGVGLVVLGPDAGFDALGIGAGVLGGVVMGVGLTLAKRWGAPAGVGPMAFAGWQLAAGGLVLAPLALLVEGVPSAIDATALAGYGWLAIIGGVVSYTLWFRGLSRLPVTATALLALLSPLVAAVLGVLVLGESFTGTQLLGFALALSALVGGQLVPACRARRHPSGAP